MGKTLLADQFSFQARTLRVYVEPSGQPLHIASHDEGRGAAAGPADDQRGRRRRIDQAVYDGKTVTLFGVEAKKYATIPVPDTIQGMLETVMGKLGVDFPLADFLTDAPDKSFLSGVTIGQRGQHGDDRRRTVPHLLFTQPPGIELELWMEKNDKALPRRLVVTYRAEPGQPSFIAEFSDWNFSVHPSDADFVFQPPDGATQIEMKPANKAAPAKPKGASP